jgi:hypothetical protein
MLRGSNVASNTACKGIRMPSLLSRFICVPSSSRLEHGYFPMLLIPSICCDSRRILCAPSRNCERAILHWDLKYDLEQIALLFILIYFFMYSMYQYSIYIGIQFLMLVAISYRVLLK